MSRITTPPSWMRIAGVRLLLLFVVFTLISAVINAINTAALGLPPLAVVTGLVTGGLTLLAYRVIVGWLEQRPVTEAEPATLLPGVGRGTLAGIGLFTLTIVVIALLGGYRIGGWGSFGAMVATFGLMCGVAVVEEILLRGIVFRILEQWAGTAIALAVSGLIFGALHLFNDGATIWGALAIAAEAGIMLGAAYVATRSLWLPIGLHLGWNFAELGLFGSTVSGSSLKDGGLVRGLATGHDAISGGAFGPEASIVAVTAGVAVSVVLLRRAAKAGRIVRPSWRR
ncbi:lysostaphin resistance A-like protein [Catenuloplanes sp. NPDC051500]|uniref:lysostaphin resistance A-like protein n=1 Tax=Catenuloplanes sp. NPDC051500 TaxID=3363959 RepID=UPI0037A9DB10